MTVYTFAPTVRIDTVTYDDATVDQITAGYGRTDTVSPVPPGSCTVQLVRSKLTGATPIPSLGAALEVDYQTGRRLFTGTVTDVTVTESTVALTAVSVSFGMLAQSKTSQALFLPGSGISTNVGAAATYIIGPTISPRTVSITTDLTGSVTLASTTYPAGTGLLELLQGIAAQEPGSVLWETTTGAIYFHGARYRRLNANSAAQWTPSAAAIISDWSATESLANRVNRATVTYSGGSVTSAALADIVTYGPYDSTLETILATAADATLIARQLVTFGTEVAWSLTGVRVDLTRWDAGSQALEFITDARAGQVVALETNPWSELPDYYFLEGWTATLSRHTFTAEIYLSNPTLTRWPQRWSDVPTATKWNSASVAGLTWNDLLKEDI